MKRFIYFLLLLPLAMVIASCDDDNKIPDVGVQAEVSNAVVTDEAIYVVRGDTLKIDAINIVNRTGKDAALGVVSYYLDYIPVGQAIVAPYAFELQTENKVVGEYLLTAEAPIYVVDYPICIGAFSFKLKIVESADDLPGTPEPATVGGVVKGK